MTNIEKSMGLIRKYIGKTVQADLDGSLFHHVPATFRFRFDDPESLSEMLQEEYEDEREDWDFSEIVPVAAVSKADEDGDEAYEFAWIFLDWSNGGDEPGIVVATTDRWDSEYGVESIEDLELSIID